LISKGAKESKTSPILQRLDAIILGDLEAAITLLDTANSEDYNDEKRIAW
jgi:hypothetical protein